MRDAWKRPSLMQGYLLLAVASMMLAPLWYQMGFPADRPALFPLHFYQRVLSPLDGHDCPSYPVCSDYARQAITRHGLLLGSWLMLDRLIHEGDDLHHPFWVLVNGERRAYDPLSRNDFWLKE
ncbi:MAG: membrane protein insertion efficiency factor YidD [Mariprofundales bacterium]|nr:membrane protein insertion efficiency factor YidD [Mariprofundales bacterium]